MIIWQAGTVLRAYALELTRGTLLDKVVPFPRKVTALRSEEQVTIPAEEIRADEALLTISHAVSRIKRIETAQREQK